jgi:hypothetical protein
VSRLVRDHAAGRFNAAFEIGREVARGLDH